MLQLKYPMWRRFVPYLFACIAASAGMLHAQPVVFLGPTGQWGTGASWVLGNAPTGSDVAQVATGTVTITGNTVGSLLFSAGTLTGTGMLTLSASGSNWSGGNLTFSSGGGITQASGGTWTIS